MIFIYFFKYETIETHARAFLALIISALGSVNTIYLSKIIKNSDIQSNFACSAELNLSENYEIVFDFYC